MNSRYFARSIISHPARFELFPQVGLGEEGYDDIAEKYAWVVSRFSRHLSFNQLQKMERLRLSASAWYEETGVEDRSDDACARSKNTYLRQVARAACLYAEATRVTEQHERSRSG